MVQSTKFLKLSAALLFCGSIWITDYVLSIYFPDYFSGILLYGSLFSLFLLKFSNHTLQEQKQENQDKHAEVLEIKNDDTQKSSVQRSGLTMEQSLKFRKMLKEHFSTTLAFRKHGYTIRDLSKEIGIPVYQLSSYINKEFGVNFNELVNAYRVEYMARAFRTSNEWKSYTLEALGNMAGFNSRAAFIAAIKKHTGMNPSEFFGRKDQNSITHANIHFSEMLKEVA